MERGHAQSVNAPHTCLLIVSTAVPIRDTGSTKSTFPKNNYPPPQEPTKALFTKLPTSSASVIHPVLQYPGSDTASESHDFCSNTHLPSYKRNYNENIEEVSEAILSCEDPVSILPIHPTSSHRVSLCPGKQKHLSRPLSLPTTHGRGAGSQHLSTSSGFLCGRQAIQAHKMSESPGVSCTNLSPCPPFLSHNTK